MKFDSASTIEQITWELRLADYERSKNRARINDLFNGGPPFTDQEAQDNNVDTNVNFLDATKIAHDARRQFYNAFLNPEPLFEVRLDSGPPAKRQEWGGIITREINRIMKRDLGYLELRRNTFASTVLHGIGPVIWNDQERWCPEMIGIEDMMVPANTLLTLHNLPFFAVFRQYTVMQLRRMTTGRRVDPAWNLALVEKLIKWADQEATRASAPTWPELWSPEKSLERVKQDTGIYCSTSVPTIDCWDFYFWNDDDKHSGWNRRIVLDTYNSNTPHVPNKKKHGGSDGEFLYNPGGRVYADSLGQIAHWQFADASSVAPFRYHSVRSLGFLLYSVCHLQNRLRCRFNDAVFESLMQYFRVASPDDMERLQKVKLLDKAALPDGLNFVKNDERWQVNDKLIIEALQLNRQTMVDNAAAFTQDIDLNDQRTEETATRTMAKVNATASLVGAMLNQAYNYQSFQYDEICRRFRRPNSIDINVQAFRSACLRQGIPKEFITWDCWDVTPVRVIGSGNKIMQIAIADKLVAMRQFLNPQAQLEVDRIYIAANSDDWDLAKRLVPPTQEITPAITEAQMAVGTLMQGLPVSPRAGIEHAPYIEAAMASLTQKVMEIEQSGGLPSPEVLRGLQLVAQHIEAHIQFLSANPQEQARVRQYGDDLMQLMNYIKKFQTNLVTAQKKMAQAQAQQQPGMDPEAAAKAQGKMMEAKAKADAQARTQAQTEAQKSVAFQQDEQRKAQEHAQSMKQKAEEHQLNLRAKAAEADANIRTKTAESAVSIHAAKQEAEAKPKESATSEGGDGKPSSNGGKRIKVVRDKSGRASEFVVSGD